MGVGGPGKEWLWTETKTTAPWMNCCFSGVTSSKPVQTRRSVSCRLTALPALGASGACKGLLWSLIDFGHILCSFFTQMFNYLFSFLDSVFPPSFLSSLSYPLIIFSSSPLHPSPPPQDLGFFLFCFLKYELGSSGRFH